MNLRILMLAALATFLLLTPCFAENEATKSFKKGEALLQKGDVEGAFKAYVTAAKADPSNMAYKEKAMLLRRALILKRFADENEQSPKWEKVVINLHAFYLTQGIYPAALSLNKKVHAKLNNSLSASLLAETLLEMNKNKETLDLINGLDPKLMDTQLYLHKAITLARLGDKKNAETILNTHLKQEIKDPGLNYDLARIHVLMGNIDAAGKNLVYCLENIPPTETNKVKGFIKKGVDFKGMANTPALALVMKTKSKIKVSACSGGSDCGSCPSRGGCSQEVKEEESGCGGCDKKSDCDNKSGCDKDK